MHAFRNATIKVIVGLGNPGVEYGLTYHNAGALALEKLKDKLEAEPWSEHRLSLYTRSRGLLLVKPELFMNDSGRAVREALKVAKATPAELLVLHDDSDLGLGTFKFSFGSRAGGHRGVQSVIDHLGTADFWRLRLGIRTKPGKAGEFVLRTISAMDRDLFYGAIDAAIENVIENVTPSED